MLYLLAVVLPPVAVLFCGKPLQAVLNFILTLFGWVPGMIHAVLVVNGHHADRRNKEILRELQKSR